MQSEEEIIKYANNIVNATFIEATLQDKEGNIIEQGFVNKDVIQGLLDLYQKEKQKNKEYENKIKSVLELIDTKPYTAYTLYGDILYDDENIRELLEERN